HDIRVDEKIVQYLTALVHCTREHEDLILGGSPRATIALYRASQALAAIQGRDYVIPDDIQHIAPPVLSHRMIIRPESRLQKITPEMVMKEVLEIVPVPTHRAG
ncbi:MAG: MoxR family ATPase, partial [Planctomycetia bacterium]